MAAFDSIVLEAPDVAAAETFYRALGVGPLVSVRQATGEEPSGFRGFTLSLVVAQPGNVDLFLNAALAAGATSLKPASKSLWGYGGVVQAPDGAIWKVASSKKKDSADPAQTYDDLVLLLGVADVKASKQFYADRGLSVDKSFGGKYAQFASADGEPTLALYSLPALAKDAGVPPEGSGPHRIVARGAAGSFTDPDGFAWETEGE